METSDESTNKVKRIDDPTEAAPKRRPIPSVLDRSAAAAKPAPTFTWPLATPKPVQPIARTPVGAKIAVPAVVRPTIPATPRAPRGTDAPPARVQAKPIEPVIEPVVERKPIAPVIEPAAPRVEPKPIAPVIEAAPPRVEAKPIAAVVVEAPEPVEPVEPPAPAVSFGSSMLQARTRRAKPSVSRDDVADVPAAPAFGAGMLQARKRGGKTLVIAFVVAVATIAALFVALRGGSNHAPAPVTTQQP
jgi:hypothetical protein